MKYFGVTCNTKYEARLKLHQDKVCAKTAPASRLSLRRDYRHEILVSFHVEASWASFPFILLARQTSKMLDNTQARYTPPFALSGPRKFDHFAPLRMHVPFTRLLCTIGLYKFEFKFEFS
jgi:hypothetical protein